MNTVDFRTKDLNLAAFLWSQDGVELTKLDGKSQGGGSTVYFAFTLPLSETEFAQLQIDHANGKTTVEPGKFCQRQGQLRDLLHTSLGTRRKSNKS